MVRLAVGLLLLLAGTARAEPVPAEDCRFAELAAGHHLQCGLLQGGRVACWGENTTGELGNGSTGVPAAQAGEVLTAADTPLTGATAISAFERHACALLASGGVRCWGANGSGRLGDGSQTAQSFAVDVRATPGGAALLGFASVSAGQAHSCGVVGDERRIVCWGEGGAGRLGNGSNMDRSTPVAVRVSPGGAVLTGWQSVSAGAAHTCAVRAAGGAVFCWGNGGDGRLGDGAQVNRQTPVAVQQLDGTPLTGAVRVVAGLAQSCAVTGAGQLFCWGDNTYGTLGDGTTTSRPRAGVVEGTGPVAAVSLVHYTLADNSAACAVGTDGALRCWGDNSSVGHFFLAQGSAEPTFSSTPLLVGDGYAQVSGGYDHACARLVGGEWRCWGHYFGDAGDGLTSEDRGLPVRVICPECKSSAGPELPTCEGSEWGAICDAVDLACGACSDDAGCSGTTPRCDLAGVHNACVACDGDLGSLGAFACLDPAAPICQPDGHCDECSAGETSGCEGGTPVCDVALGECVPCSGDFGSGSPAPCPSAGAPTCQGGSCMAVLAFHSPQEGARLEVNTPLFDGTGPPGRTVLIVVDGVLTCTAITDDAGHWSCRSDLVLADGPHTAQAALDDGSATAEVHFSVYPGPLIDDQDGDGWLDVDDNCPTISNVDQADLDGDDRGDACDSGYGISGGGCGVAGESAHGWLLLAVLLLVRRRRSAW